MGIVVLIGTSHSIQLGKNSSELFKDVLLDECRSNRVQAIAEEIQIGAETVALEVTRELNLKHLYADPDLKERRAAGIETDIERNLMEKYGDEYPEIRMWPSEPSTENLPPVVWEEYYDRTNAAYRAREKYWLARINRLNQWPLLFICGANHFDEFAKLLAREGKEVVQSHRDWEPG